MKKLITTLLVAISLLLVSCSFDPFENWDNKYDIPENWIPRVAASNNNSIFSISSGTMIGVVYQQISPGKYIPTGLTDGRALGISPNGEWSAYSSTGAFVNQSGIYESFKSSSWSQIVNYRTSSFQMSVDSPLELDNSGNAFWISEVVKGGDHQNGLLPGYYLLETSSSGNIKIIAFSSAITWFSVDSQYPLVAFGSMSNSRYQLEIYNYQTRKIIFTWNKHDVRQMYWTADGKILYFVAYRLQSDPDPAFASNYQPSSLYGYINGKVKDILNNIFGRAPGGNLTIDPVNDHLLGLLAWRPMGSLGASSLWLLNAENKKVIKIVSYEQGPSWTSPYGFSADGKYLAFETPSGEYSEIGIYDLETHELIHPDWNKYFSYSVNYGDAAWEGNSLIFMFGYKPNNCKGICRATVASFDPVSNRFTILAVRPGANQARSLGLCGGNTGLTC